MTGFKNFILRGNLIDLAVAVIIGTAFAAVITTFTAMVLSAIGKVFDGKSPDFENYSPGGVPVGGFVTALIALAASMPRTPPLRSPRTSSRQHSLLACSCCR